MKVMYYTILIIRIFSYFGACVIPGEFLKKMLEWRGMDAQLYICGVSPNFSLNSLQNKHIHK